MSYTVKTTDGETVNIVRSYIADGSRPAESRVLVDELGRTLRPIKAGLAEVIEILDDAKEAATEQVKEVVEEVKETVSEAVEEVKDEVADAVEAVGDAAGAALDSVQDALTGNDEETTPGLKPEEETPAA